MNTSADNMSSIDEIRMHQLYLEAVLESAPDAIVTLDAESNITGWNKSAERLFGYPSAEALGKNVDDLIVSSDAIVHKEAVGFSKHVSNKKPVGPIETVRYNRDGAPLHVILASSPVSVNDVFKGSVAVYTDITERKQTEQALRENERFLQSVFDAIQDGISVLDADLTVIRTNRWMEQMYANQMPLVGRKCYQVYQERKSPCPWCPSLKSFETGKTHTETVPYPSAEDPQGWIELTAFPIKNEFGKVENVIEYVKDITDRKGAEKLQVSIYEIARAAIDAQSLDELYAKIHAILQNLLPTQYFYIALYDQEKDLLSFPYFQDAFDTVPPPATLGRGLTEYVLRTRKPLLATEEMMDEMVRNGEIESIGPDSIEWLGVPLITQNQAIGVMVVQNYEETVHLGSNDLEVLDYVSTQVASAIERKQAEAKLHRRADEFTALYETARDLTAQHDLPVLLHAIAERASALLHAPGGAIYLYDAAHGDLELVLTVGFSIPAGTRLQMGEGVAGRVAQTLQPLIVDNYCTWEGRSRKFEDLPIKAVVQVPMLYGGELIGVLATHEASSSERTFTQEDTHLLSLFAEYAAGAVRTARLLQETRRQVNELTALYQTTLDVISVHDLPDLLYTIVMRAVDSLGGTGGGLYLCDQKKEQVRCVVSYKTSHDYTDTVLAYGEGAAGIVAATGKPMLIEDYRTWEGRARAYEKDQPFSALISVPLIWQGQVTGVIHVLHDTEKHIFKEEDLKLLTSFANQATIAVENARLLDETQRRFERLSALRRIEQVITSSLDLRMTFSILLGQVIQQLEVDAAAVLLYEPELQSLKFVAGQGFRTQALQFTDLHLGQGFAGLAALEQQVIQVYDLSTMQTGFLRSPEFRSEGFVAYIGVPLIAKGNIIGVLEIYHRRSIDHDREWMTFLETLAGQAAIAIDNIRMFEDVQKSNLQLRQAYDATIEGWALALEMRDRETEGHSRRVVDWTLELARKLGIEEKQLVPIRRGALLHDIGKMGIPDSILQKREKLTEEDWRIIQQHPVYAHQWLASIQYLQASLDIPYCHHEKWNGTGYPRGLKGEQIPLAARIFAVVDVWDALLSDRSYRKAWSQDEALAYLSKQSGQHFDPRVVDAFIDLLSEKGYLNQS